MVGVNAGEKEARKAERKALKELRLKEREEKWEARKIEKEARKEQKKLDKKNQKEAENNAPLVWPDDCDQLFLDGNNM